jgi:hypothetical protein
MEAKIDQLSRTRYSRNSMSAPTPHTAAESDDPVEKIVPFIPFVLPMVGGVLMFLLAFIAVYMA